MARLPCSDFSQQALVELGESGASEQTKQNDDKGFHSLVIAVRINFELPLMSVVALGCIIKRMVNSDFAFGNFSVNELKLGGGVDWVKGAKPFMDAAKELGIGKMEHG